MCDLIYCKVWNKISSTSPFFASFVQKSIWHFGVAWLISQCFSRRDLKLVVFLVYPWIRLLFNYPTFYQFVLSFLFINKTSRLNNLKTRTAMKANISLHVTCVEAIIYLLLYNLHGCSFKIFQWLPKSKFLSFMIKMNPSNGNETRSDIFPRGIFKADINFHW